MRDRVLAVLGAIALVAVALVLRAQFSGDGGGSGSGAADGGPPVVACTPDLMAVCEALAADGRIAAGPPKLDLDGAAAPGAAIDAWITWDPAPGIANFDADAAGRVAPWDSTVVVASDVLAVLTSTSGVTDLGTSCNGAVTWACLASPADPADIPSLGFGRPTTAEGLARIGPVAKALDTNDRNEVDVATLKALLDGPQDGQGPASQQANALITRGTGDVGAVIGPAERLRAATGTQQGSKAAVVVPTEKTTVSVVIAARPGFDPGELAEQATADRAEQAMKQVGASGAPSGQIDTDLAGFLFQVREKVG